MPEPLLCDGCGTIGLRPLDYPCPADWFFIKTFDEGGGGDFYVYACSRGCKDKLWKPGPGPKLEGLRCLRGSSCNLRDCPTHGVFPSGDG